MFKNKINPVNDQEDSAEKLRPKKTCPCGYNPHKETSFNYEKCSCKLALRNHITFPSFDLISEYDSPSTLYFDYDNVVVEPYRNWATCLGKSKQMNLFIRIQNNLYKIF